VKTLFVMDPLDRLNLAGDSTYALMLEATARGWPVWWCTPADLRVVHQRARVHARSVVSRLGPDPFEQGDREDLDLGSFDAVWMRKDPPFDMDYVFSTYILDLVTDTTLVVNDPRTVKCANEKMYALQWPELCPETLVTNRVADVIAFATEHGRIVLKPWDGNGGRGVLVTAHGDRNLRSMAEILTEEGRAYAMVQRYLPEIAQGDKRILLIDGVPRGWFSRVPGTDDHRGNMHVGAGVVAFDLSERDRAICDALAPRLKEEGLLFVGIDIIGEHLTEINVTSPTGIWEVRELMQRDLAPELLDAAQAAR